MEIFSFLFGKKDVTGPRQRMAQSDPSKDRPDTDWPSSNAHLSLLSRFLFACDVISITKFEMDTTVKESTQRVLDRFIAEGWLIPASLSAKLFHAFNGTTIRALLKERGLRISGSKDEGIERLVVADSDGMAAKVAQLKLYECSPKARELVAPLVSAQKEKQQAAEEKRPAAETHSFEQLRARDFSGASLTVANFEAGQVRPRGVGIDWSKHNTSGDVAMLKGIFERRPKILGGLAEGQWEPLRIGAAMMHLWGTSRASRWLPEGLTGHGKFDNDTAARMLLFNAQHHARMARDREKRIKRFEILGSGDSCPACKRIAGKRYSINKVPELPYEHCTHEMGCRCEAQPLM